MKSILFHRSALLHTSLILVAVALHPVGGSAAPIHWGTAITIAGDADVATSGTLLYAFDLSNTAQAVNGVNFAAANSTTTLGGGVVTMSGFAGNNGTVFGAAGTPYNNLSAAYKNIIKGATYGNSAVVATVNLNNLTVGKTYLVQFWVLDGRAGATTNRYETLQGGGGNTVTPRYYIGTGPVGGLGQFVVGVFTADATSQSFTLTPGAFGGATSSAQINAIQVRDLGVLSAASGTWNTLTSGLAWSTAANWLGNAVANGSGSTADFGALDLAADVTVGLDTPRIIGHLTFGDTDSGTAGGWVLTNNGVAANFLALSGTTPTITVNTLGTGKAATLAATLAGANSLTKAGTGTLVLSATNVYTGGTIISAGGLTATLPMSMGPGPVTVNGTLNLAAAPGASVSYTGLVNSMSGNGTVNVTLGTVSQTVALNGTNSNFTGIINVGVGAAAGAGKVQLNGLLGSTATVNALANASVYCNGATVNQPATIVLNGGDTGETLGQLRVEGGATWSGPLIIAGAISSGNDGHLGANSGIGNITGNIGESGGPQTLVKVGGGTIVLSGVNSYSGGTLLRGGPLVLNGYNAAPMTANAGTTLSGTGTNAGPLTLNGTLLPGSAGVARTLTLGGLTLNGGSTLTLDLTNNPTIGGGLNDLIQLTGGATNTGTTTVNFNFTAGLPAIGVPYTIITGTAMDPAFNTANLVSSSFLPATFSVSGNDVQVTFTARSYDLVWQGDPAVGTNWANGVLGWTNVAGTGTPEAFYVLDTVTFDDTGTNLVANTTNAVYPASVTVNATANNYTFGGAGGIAGIGGLTKDGSSVLTLTNYNSYTGPTVVKAGTLRLNLTNSLPLASAISVSNGAVLDLNFITNAGAVVWPSTNTLDGTGTVRVNTGSGANNIYLRNNMSAFSGLLDVIPSPSGKLSLSQMIAGPGAGATLRVQNGATVFLAGGKNLLCTVELYGGTTGEAFGQLRIDSNTTNYGPLVLKANTTIGNQAGTSSFGYINGTISDDGLGYGFTKQGNGYIVLSAANTFSGQTMFAAGTTALRLNHPAALQNSTVNLTVNNGLTFQAGLGGAFTLGGLTGSANQALADTGSGAVNLLVGNNHGSTTYGGVLSGVGGLTKVGNGTFTLGAISTHTGTTYANAGVLQLGASGGINNASTIQVGASGMLDVSLVTGGFAVRANQTLSGFGVVTGNVGTVSSGILAPGTVGTAGTLSFSNTLALTDAVLKFDLADVTTAGGGTNDLIISGTLALNGMNNIQVNRLNGSLATGTYTLISGITNIPAGGLANLQFGYPLRDASLSFVESEIPGVTNLVLTLSSAGSPLVWVGTNNLWDAATTFNWTNLTTLLPDRFFSFDQVVFDDTLTANPVVTLVGSLQPDSVTVSNISTNFTFAGAGGIGGQSALKKMGTGLLTIANPNTHTGGTIVGGGTMVLSNALALGSVIASVTTISNGATLDISSQELWNYTQPLLLHGAGTAPSIGALTKNAQGNGSGLALRSITLGSDASIGGVAGARIDIGRGDWANNIINPPIHIDGQGYTLSLVGNIYVGILAGAQNLAGLVINAGCTNAPHASNSMGNATVTLNGGALSPWGAHDIPNPFVINSGFIDNQGYAQPYTAPIQLNGPLGITVSAATIAFSNNVTGLGSITKLGPSTLVLNGTNTYSGPTTISAGSVLLTSSGSISNTAAINLAAGASLNAIAAGGISRGMDQSLTGSGSVAGPVAATAGSQIVPGGTGLGTLTLSNGLSLADVALLDFQLGATTNEGAGINDLIQINGDLNLTGVSTVKVSAVALLDMANPYTLINYSGALVGDAANLTVVTDSRQTFALDLTVTNKIRLSVTGGAGTLLWVGGNPDATWDTRSTANWDNGFSEDIFYPGDTVNFDNGYGYTAIDLAGDLQPALINVYADIDLTFQSSGRLASGRLNKSGIGTLTLANSGVNFFPAGALISAGALQIGAGGTTGSYPDGAITNNAAVVFNRSDDITVANTLAGSGVVRKVSANTLTLTGTNTHLGGTIVESGTLKVQNNQALGDIALGVTTVSNGATLDISSYRLDGYLQPMFLSGFGTGPSVGALTKSASVVGAGYEIRSIVLGGDTSIGAVTNARIDIGRIDWGGNLVNPPIHIDGNSNTLSLVGNVYLGILAGATNLAGFIINSNTVAAPHASNSLGEATITLNGGTLSPWGHHDIPNPLVVQSGFINNQTHYHNYTAPVQINGPVQITVNAGGDLTFSNTLSGAGSVTKLGANSILLKADNSGFTGSWTNSQSNTFFDAAAAGSSNAAWILNAGNLANRATGTPTIHLGSFSGTGGLLGNNVAAETVTFSVGFLGSNDVFAGSVVDSIGGGGTAALAKVGAGTLTLAGTNNYSGGTMVSEGTLRYDGVQLASAGTLSVAGGTLAGNGQINAPVQVLSGGTLAPGASIGVLTISNNLVLGGSTVFELDKANATNDLVRGLSNVVFGGTLAVTNLGGTLADGDTFQLFAAGAYSGSFSSIQLPALPSTLRWNLSNLANNGSISVVPNLPPVPVLASLSTLKNKAVTVGAAKLLARCTDPEGDAFSVIGVSPSTNGAIVTLLSGNITYTPVSGFTGTDLFTYTLADSLGATSVGSVQVTVTDAPSLNRVSYAYDPDAGTMTLTFAGIPGMTYRVQYATTLTPPADWTDFSTNTAPPSGLFQVVDPVGVDTNRFYRTLQP